MRGPDGDRGAVTVEAALALCSLVAVMVLVVASVAASSAHLRCLDAAREAARLVARGEPDRAREAAAAIAPRDASVEVRVVGDQVDVRVSVRAVPGLPGLALAAEALAVLEPGVLVAAEGGGGPPDPGPSHEPAAERPDEPPSEPPGGRPTEPASGVP